MISGMAAASDVLLKVGDNRTRIIPGHGPMALKEDLKTTPTCSPPFTSVWKNSSRRKTVDEAIAAAPTKDFDAMWGKGSMKPDVFTRVAYTSIRRHNLKS